ncbi:hypothetical protein SAY86_028225 [Trapa natans]|uniref:Calmodulin-binding domain-containing protein n=1 Tax=Trapa natans TaxID=22666 RepID=A0AAN7M1W7_TRANT|nr:hypothetical protein SAY86_028225 [Trapa natans]
MEKPADKKKKMMMKKKKKKSRSPGSEIPPPGTGKPPSLRVRPPNSAAETPLNPHRRSSSDDGIPNYMNPTRSSSGDGRKGPSSSGIGTSTGSSSDTNIMSIRKMSSSTSKTDSLSGHTSTIIPMENPKSSSASSRSRLVRTLPKKTPSINPVLGSSSSATKRSSNVRQRATCPSTLKDSNFPNYLTTTSPVSTGAHGTSSMRVCPYNYCSLNGHHHPPPPPRKCFKSSTSKAIKTQNSLKTDTTDERTLVCSTPKRMEAATDLYIEIYPETNYACTCCQNEERLPEEEMKKSKVQEEAVERKFLGNYDHPEVENTGEGETKYLSTEWDGGRYSISELDEAEHHSTEEDVEEDVEKSEIDFLVIHLNKAPDEEVRRKGEDEASPEAELPRDQDLVFLDSCQVLDCLSYNQCSSPEEDEDELEEATADAEESSEQAESTGKDGSPRRSQEECDSTCLSLEQELEISSNQQPPPCLCQVQNDTAEADEEEKEEPGGFNPGGPNYLPIAPKTEVEKVDLRHLQLDNRRNSDEWKVDYALRQAVTRLAVARKRKVELLVEAFEKVMPIP